MLWLGLSVPLLLYAGAVHLLRLRSMPKELLVGLFFAVAVVMPACIGQARLLPLLFQGGLFGSLCWLNCIAIARWQAVEAPVWQRSAASGSVRLRSLLLLLLAGCAAALAVCPLLIVLPIALAAFVLLLLNEQRRCIEPVRLRALADAALLTPLLVLPFLH